MAGARPRRCRAPPGGARSGHLPGVRGPGAARAVAWGAAAGLDLAGELCLDFDATILIAHSEKGVAIPTWKPSAITRCCASWTDRTWLMAVRRSPAFCVSITEFEADRDRNLYRIWNRMSSGLELERGVDHPARQPRQQPARADQLDAIGADLLHQLLGEVMLVHAKRRHGLNSVLYSQSIPPSTARHVGPVTPFSGQSRFERRRGVSFRAAATTSSALADATSWEGSAVPMARGL
jgi:hypothetical protein